MGAGGEDVKSSKEGGAGYWVVLLLLPHYSCSEIGTYSERESSRTRYDSYSWGITMSKHYRRESRYILQQHIKHPGPPFT